MAMYKTAQFYDMNDHRVEVEEMGDDGDVILYDAKPTEEQVVEMHREEAPGGIAGHMQEMPVEVVFTLPTLPGSDATEDVMTDCEVEVDGDDKEENEKSKGKKEDKNEVDEVEDTDPWTSWKKKGPKHFNNWAKDMLNFIPRHSGREVSGLQRSKAFLEKHLKVMSDAIRNDLMGDIDIAEFEHIRREVLGGIDRLEKAEKAMDKKPAKKGEERHAELVKEAQRAAGISGIVVTVPLIISTIARTAINSSISAGKDMEKVVAQLIKQFDLSKREQAELVQHLQDMNYTVRRPRCLDFNESFDQTSEDNLDFAPNYTA